MSNRTTLWKAFIKFNRGVLKMPFFLQFWLMLLVIANLVVPLFFFNHLESQVVFVTMLVSMSLMPILTSLFGFTRLLGLGHILWIPLLYFLWSRLGQIPANDFFGIWIRVLMVLNALSLAIDAIDVIRYIAGDREETIRGL